MLAGHFIFISYLFAYCLSVMCLCAHMPPRANRGWRTSWGGQLSPSTVEVLGIKLELSSSTASAFPAEPSHWSRLFLITSEHAVYLPS